MRRVRDRERKHFGRKTISGRLKRRLEYRARRAAQREQVPRASARDSHAAVHDAAAPVGGYRSLADEILSSAAPEEEPADDRKTPADS
jgi:hypothetical protein